MDTGVKGHSWASLIHTVRAAAATVSGVTLALLLPSQTQDIVSGLWEGPGPWHGAALTFHLLLAMLGISAWHWSRAALSARFSIADTATARRTLHGRPEQVDAQAVVYLPRILYLVTFVAALVVTARSVGTSTPGGWWQTLSSYCAIALLWLAGLLLLIYRLPMQHLVTGREDQTAAERCPGWMQWMPGAPRTLLRHAPFGPIFATCLLGFALLAFVAGTLGTLVEVDGSRVALPLALGRMFPGPGAFVLALAIAIAPLTLLTYTAGCAASSWTAWGFKVRARWTPVLLLLAFLTAYVPTKVHLHQVRIVESSHAMRPDGRATLPDLLASWAAACPGLGPLRPVIVAVSGGASRAGLWGARVLKDVDSAARASGTGIFAISSVSGGSLGAAGYMTWRAALQDGEPCVPSAASAPPDGPMIAAMRGDALGPLLAGALFGDVPRAMAGAVLLPAAWVADIASKFSRGLPPRWAGMEARLPRGGDRAAALERAFEANWREAFQDQAMPDRGKVPGLDQPYLALAYAAAAHPRGSGVPVWIANGTDQQNGERLLTVPFRPDTSARPASGTDMQWPFDGAKDVLALVGADMPVSAVIDNTARFPFLSPVGELGQVGHDLVGISAVRPTQIFDGGYFDNGGLQSAVELADWLGRQVIRGRFIRPIIVQATADAEGDPDKMDATIPRCGDTFRDAPEESAGTRADDQLTAPVRGLNGVRRGHSGLVLRQVLHRYCASPQRFFHFYLYSNPGHAVPLNWSLSDTIAQYIWNDVPREKGNSGEMAKLRSALKEDDVDGTALSKAPIAETRNLTVAPRR